MYKELLQIDNSVYENILENFYAYSVEPGDVVVDVGAHVGRHTIPMARAVGDGGEVVAFEPLPNLWGRLSEEIQRNDVESIVTLHHCALSDAGGNSEFLYVEDSPGLSGLKERTSHAGHEISRINVEVKRLDEVVPEGKKISFIKVDAEGADFFILRGARRILSVDRPFIVFESGRINAFPAKSYDYSEQEFHAFFDEIGYVLYDIAGFKYDPFFWNIPTLNDFVALPREREAEGRQLLTMAVVGTLVGPFID